jgi:hypothetical protein
MGEKGLMEEDWDDRQLEEEDIVIVKWAQEDVETLYSLLNYIYIYVCVCVCVCVSVVLKYCAQPYLLHSPIFTLRF